MWFCCSCGFVDLALEPRLLTTPWHRGCENALPPYRETQTQQRKQGPSPRNQGTLCTKEFTHCTAISQCVPMSRRGQCVAIRVSVAVRARKGKVLDCTDDCQLNHNRDTFTDF